MNKFLLPAVLLLLPFAAFSQNDCSKLLKSENYSGTEMISSKEPIVVYNALKEAVNINWVYGSNLMLVIKSDVNLKCVGTNANMDIHFTDGTKLSVKHMGNMNCEGNYALFLGEVFQNQNILDKLKKTKVKKMAITYSDMVDGKLVLKTEEFSLSGDQSEKFNKTLNCITSK